MTLRFHLGLAAAFALFAKGALALSYAPEAVNRTGLMVELTYAGQFADPGSRNVASPVAVGDHLYVVDQDRGTIAIQDAAGPRTVLDSAGLPAGITPTGKSGIFNMAGRGDRAYVGFTSSTVPTGLAPAPLPSDPFYVTTSPSYQVIYAYDRAPDGTLSNPRALTAFETGLSSPDGGAHFGEGMLVLPDGRLLLSRGDNLNQKYDGLAGAQDPGTTVAKLIIVDGDNGTTQVAATGVRNAQRLIYTDDSQTRIAFSDIGRTVAEEINVIDVAALLDTSEIENFGWGRNPDGKAREGTFYINQGEFAGEVPMAVGEAPMPEPGFLQPHAQFGREDAPWIAVSGPVVSDQSFDVIDMLFGDLARGTLFATVSSAFDVLNPVHAVAVRGADGRPSTLQEVLGVDRADVRFFNFVDGSAGLLLEGTGAAYRIAEVAAAVPLPAAGTSLVLGLMALSVVRRRKMAGTTKL